MKGFCTLNLESPCCRLPPTLLNFNPSLSVEQVIPSISSSSLTCLVVGAETHLLSSHRPFSHLRGRNPIRPGFKNEGSGPSLTYLVVGKEMRLLIGSILEAATTSGEIGVVTRKFGEITRHLVGLTGEPEKERGELKGGTLRVIH